MALVVGLGSLLCAIGCRHASDSVSARSEVADAPTGLELPSLARFEFHEPHMGVPFRIVLYASNETVAAQAAATAFRRIGALNAVMSDYETDSELNRLCRTSGPGMPRPVSDDLWRVLRHAQILAAQSQGAFDVTVGPYVGLWRKARREHALPKASLLEDARSRVGWKWLTLHPSDRSVELQRPVMHLDLGGIAKGYAVDEARRVLADLGIHRCLVSGGGDMAAGEPPPGQQGWNVKLDSVADGRSAEETWALWLNQEAVATSGDTFQFVEIDGVRYSHIVDPRTGLGLTNQSLVTVLAPDGMTADSLATTLSVLGPEAGSAFVRRFPEVEARFLWRDSDDLKVSTTAGFAERLHRVKETP